MKIPPPWRAASATGSGRWVLLGGVAAGPRASRRGPACRQAAVACSAVGQRLVVPEDPARSVRAGGRKHGAAVRAPAPGAALEHQAHPAARVNELWIWQETAPAGDGSSGGQEIAAERDRGRSVRMRVVARPLR